MVQLYTIALLLLAAHHVVCHGLVDIEDIPKVDVDNDEAPPVGRADTFDSKYEEDEFKKKCEERRREFNFDRRCFRFADDRCRFAEDRRRFFADDRCRFADDRCRFAEGRRRFFNQFDLPVPTREFSC